MLATRVLKAETRGTARSVAERLYCRDFVGEVFGAVVFRREDTKWSRVFLSRRGRKPIRALKHSRASARPISAAVTPLTATRRQM